MLIRFTVENFRSFYEEAVFSMLPGRMQKHAKHIISGNTANDIDVLQTGLLYGANASGKSNLIRAMDFARSFIVKSPRPKQRIQLEPFRLKKEALQQPARFEFEFISEGQAYAYGFVIGNRRVHEEWLYLMDKQKETALFERTSDEEMKVKVSFPNLNLLPNYEEQFLHFVAQSTRPNQLFLSKSAEDNLTDLAPIFDWFDTVLTIIFPDTRAQGIQWLIREDKEFAESLSKFLSAMNTGIDKICFHPMDIDSIPLPANVLSEILADLDDDARVAFDTPQGSRYIISPHKEGEHQIYSLGTVRQINDIDEVTFDINEESDGTQRLFDLFPVAYSTESKVFVIDELERSLHPNLVRQFIQWLLDSDSTNQLIVSTHEATLLDLDLLRRDEIWFVEKDPSGNSTLYSLEEFKPRADLDIRKGYLHGRFGAIPVLGSSLNL